MPAELLEPVAAGQKRFRAPGLSVDGRGVAVGREVLVVLGTFERVVAFLGACSPGLSMAELFQTLTIERARQAGGGTEFLVRFAARDSFVLDEAARAAAPARGRVYTGSGTVYVRIRDNRAPFGYDLAEPVPGEGATVVAVDRDGVRRYRVEGQVDPFEMVLRLRPRLAPHEDDLPDRLLLLCEPGIAQRVVHDLFRRRASFAATALSADHGARLLVRVSRPTQRTFDRFRDLPGVTGLQPVGPKMAVEVGYRHPLDLEALSAAFPEDEVYLFLGRSGRVERLSPPPRFVDGRHLVTWADAGALEATVTSARQMDLSPVRIALQLRRSDRVREPRGLCVPRDRMPLLAHLVRRLPAQVLAACRVAVLEDEVVLLATELLARGAGVLAVGAMLPVGTRLQEVAPGVMVPDGFDLFPRVRPDLLRELLGLSGADHVLFREPKTSPVRLAADRLVPLDAAMMAALQPQEAPWDDDAARAAVEAAPADPEVRYAPIGRFALWGFPPAGRPGPAALGPGESES